ncbi:autophagy-related protein 22-like protein [Halteromyces radiatus]|uniref:autophagy-related protein 22-like protein n=1 Tax=Halteromyces radiatus TaxID=101107 RepID=UPI00221FE3B7|nr:autophagy-related protein 22-like protein [Halteromyces radiatus]KAI8089703.1 autophagy-related protein 22-like protein [Halteromyces radiatus]
MTDIDLSYSLKDQLRADPFASTEDQVDDTTEAGKIVKSQPPATKWELWGYYLYYNGNNGFTMNSYMTNILQSLAFQGGFVDPLHPEIKGCPDSQGPCFVNWGVGSVPVQSMMLYLQAISFSIQFTLFTSFGSLADYGKWNRYILLTSTIITCACQILPIVLVNDDGTHWNGMLALDLIGLIAYGTTLVFYGAAFPTLSDNLPVVRQARADPQKSKSEKMAVVERWRNHVSAISTTFSNIGFLVVTGVLSGASYYPWSNYTFPEGTEAVLGNAPIFNYIATVVCGGYFVIFMLPYFIAQPRGRRGPDLPPGENHLTIGWKSVIQAVLEARRFRYLFIYIFAYFLFSDAVSTTNQMIGIIQGNITNFSALQTTILNLASAVTSIIGCLFFLYISKQFGVRTKLNLIIIIVLSGVIAVWGCFGIGLDNFGFKNTWELWFFYVWSGLFTAPIWAWQQTMLAELTPKGKENLFFGLFGVVNKGSAWVGPVIIGALTQKTSNIYTGWAVVLTFFVVGLAILFFVDVKKAKLEIEQYYKEVEEQELAKVNKDNIGNKLQLESSSVEKILVEEVRA